MSDYARVTCAAVLPAGAQLHVAGSDMDFSSRARAYRDHLRWCREVILVCCEILAREPALVSLHHVNRETRTLGRARRRTCAARWRQSGAGGAVRPCGRALYGASPRQFRQGGQEAARERAAFIVREKVTA